MRPFSIKPTSLDIASHATSAKTLGNHRPLQSPVPYLFGGLAAMLGLIAFALLILACSYWRLATSREDSNDGEKQSGSGKKSAYEEKILVIMAGDDLPRFLATPAANKCVCGGHEGKMIISEEQGGGTEEEKMGERES